MPWSSRDQVLAFAAPDRPEWSGQNSINEGLQSPCQGPHALPGQGKTLGPASIVTDGEKEELHTAAGD